MLDNADGDRRPCQKHALAGDLRRSRGGHLLNGPTMNSVKRNAELSGTDACSYHQWTYDLKGNLFGVPFRRGLDNCGGMPSGIVMPV